MSNTDFVLCDLF